MDDPNTHYAIIYQRQCPSCLKRFFEISGLMAHFEIRNSRCYVTKTKGFAKLVNMISGGFLNVAAKRNDRGGLVYQVSTPEGYW